MDFAGRAAPAWEDKTNTSTHSVRIFRRPNQTHSQTRLATNVPEQPRLRAILRHGEICAPVMVKIGRGGSTLFAVNLDPGLLAGNCLKISLPVVAQE